MMVDVAASLMQGDPPPVSKTSQCCDDGGGTTCDANCTIAKRERERATLKEECRGGSSFVVLAVGANRDERDSDDGPPKCCEGSDKRTLVSPRPPRHSEHFHRHSLSVSSFYYHIVLMLMPTHHHTQQ